MPVNDVSNKLCVALHKLINRKQVYTSKIQNKTWVNVGWQVNNWTKLPKLGLIDPFNCLKKVQQNSAV